MPSEKQAHKARMALAFRQAKEHHKNFRLLEVTPVHVLFFFGGHQIRYEFYQGEVVRVGRDYPYLQPEDYAYLTNLAENEMKACVRGLNSNKSKTAEKRAAAKPIQAELPFLFTGQPEPKGSLM